MDYKKLGLKIGIEIHQQIEGHKLFCRCPTVIRDDKPDFIVKRFLRASAGETGEKDVAAMFEEKKGKYFVYQGYDTTCLVELDECPPKEINKDALEIGLQVSLLLNCKISNAIEIMRKVVVDGSNTSGFQRSMLLGRDGYVEVDGKRIGIDGVFLEEEACQVIERTEKYDVYNLSRLGIPLIEIGTKPDINSPDECRKVAEKIGMILRSVEGVKRGLGTIRQDVNISIKKGNRVEIKGFQDLRYIKKVIENEVKRQLRGNVKSEVRKANPDGSTEYLRPMPGAARMYPESDERIIHVTNNMLKNIKLPELIAEKVEKLVENFKINPDVAREIVEKKIDFKKYLRYKLKPDYIAKVLVEVPKEIKSRFGIKKKISEKDFEEVFGYVERGLVNKNNVMDVLLEKLEKGKINVKKYKEVGDSELKKEIKKIVEKNKGVGFNGLMGEVMKKFKGKVDGKKAAKIIKELI